MFQVKQCVEEGKPFGLSSSLTTVHSKAVDSEEIIGTIVVKFHLNLSPLFELRLNFG